MHEFQNTLKKLKNKIGETAINPNAAESLESFEKELRLRYLHGKIVEEKGWIAETAERKMCIALLGDGGD